MYVNVLGRIFIATAVVSSTLMALILIPFSVSLSDLEFPYINGFPRSVFLIDAILSCFLCSVLRISKRLYNKGLKHIIRDEQRLKTIVLGAGNTGAMISMDIQRGGQAGFAHLGLLDDDTTKIRRIYTWRKGSGADLPFKIGNQEIQG